MAIDKKAAREFSKKWACKGSEAQESQKFWTLLLSDVLRYDNMDSVLFEKPVANGGKIDVWIRDAGVMIEQKSYGIDLDKPETRQGKSKTPFVQVLDYAEDLPFIEQPRYLITCNFGLFRIYNRESASKTFLLNKPTLEFTLEEFGKHPEYLNFIIDSKNSRLEKEKIVSIQAGELVGKLYDRLRKNYFNLESEEVQHSLNVLCVRLVFCLYCEDAGLFEKDAFYEYLEGIPADDVRIRLKRLFKALDTPFIERDPYDKTTAKFPYVNGGLFKEDTEIPNFTLDMQEFLLYEVSGPLDWSQISPTIFGGIFESTLNPETRRKGGMHYTSPENIHKVIDPLFLSDLKSEFINIRDNFSLTPRQKRNRYLRFHTKLCSLKFLDPSCGSGNFLTETYICLRKLEDLTLTEIYGGQIKVSISEDEVLGKRVSLNQFYGIEINDFAVTVAETALWISRLKANGETEMLLTLGDNDFPLIETANIVHGNALTLNWHDVLASSECSYLMGNPPFLGARNQDKKQKLELRTVFKNAKNSGNIDYVSGWFLKAAEYMKGFEIQAGLVSTNSICQGEQVATIWKPIFDMGFHINFAHNTFRWKNEASGQAHVSVIIVGFSMKKQVRCLYSYSSPDSDPIVMHPERLNAYLTDAEDVFIWERSTPLCPVPEMKIGSQPIDDGNYIFTLDEKNTFIKKEPSSEKFFHPFIGSSEFINRNFRWVMWLGNATEEEINNMPLVKARVEKVRVFRAKSKRLQTFKAASKPTHFGTEILSQSTSIIVPETSSERRKYVPMGFVEPDVFCSNAVRLIADASLYHFGVLQSLFHNAWMRAVSGRLESRYRYSAGIVYNNFIWPTPSDEKRQRIEATAQKILEARNNHPNKTFAYLYDISNMPSDLKAAHDNNDKAVESAYGVDFHGDENKIVAHLFKLYKDYFKMTKA